MRWILGTSLAAMLCTAANATDSASQIEPGIYSNEEEVYFDKLAKRAASGLVFITVEKLSENDVITFVDRFGKPMLFAPARHTYTLTAQSAGRILFTPSEGKATELRRARPVSCWVSIRKDKPKEDGSEDWYFQSGVKLHDQGGRAIVGGGDTGVQPVVIRVRNVTWDTGSTNAPVVALYIHKPDNIDHAESYSWAAPDSARVGINLRWVQAGCAIEGLGTPSKLNNDTFKSNEEAKAQ
jgi:hypothetical protein